MANGEPRKDMDHYCIQAKRIEAMDKKLDALTGHFHIGGVIWEMSGSIKKMASVVESAAKENGKKNSNNDGTLPVKYLIWIVLGLTAILAALVGVKVPF
jgi:hypothetical protein